MSTSSKTSTIGALGRPSAQGGRRALLWVATLVAAIVLAAVAAYVVHRVTTKTDAPTVTQQQVVPQERSVNPSKRLIQINDGSAPDAAPAPAAPRGQAGMRTFDQ